MLIWPSIFNFIKLFDHSFFSLSAFLTLSIIASLLCIPLLVFASIGLSEESSRTYYHNYHGYRRTLYNSRNYTKSAEACYGFQIFAALVQAGVAIATSAMSCRIICCSKQDYSQGVVYSPAQNQPQQFMMVPPNQFSNPPQFVTVPSNQVAPFAQVGSPAVMQQHGKIPELNLKIYLNLKVLTIFCIYKQFIQIGSNCLILKQFEVLIYKIWFFFQDHLLHHMGMKIKNILPMFMKLVWFDLIWRKNIQH